MSGDAPRGERPAFEVVVFDYEGVCTPSAREYIGDEARRLPPLRPELSSVIAELRGRGTSTALLSNEFDRAWASQIDGLSDFDHIFVGSDNRIFKPDRRAFERVLYVVGCAPEQCLFVDDDEVNVRVARSIGCDAVHFDTSDVAASWAAVRSVCREPS